MSSRKTTQTLLYSKQQCRATTLQLVKYLLWRGFDQDLRDRAPVKDVVPVQPPQVHLRHRRRAGCRCRGRGRCLLPDAHRKRRVQRLQNEPGDSGGQRCNTGC